MAAVVNHVVQHELEIERHRIIVNSEKRPGRGPVFRRELLHFGQFCFEAVFVESHDVFGVADIRGDGVVIHFEFAGEETVEKPDVGRSDMPGEFEGAARVRVRTVAFFGDGDGFENAASG